MSFRKLSLAFAVGAGVLALGFFSQAGEGKKEGAKEGKKEERVKISAKTQAVADIAAAYRLVELGRQAKSPEMLLSAARIIYDANTEAAALPKGSKVGKALEANDNKFAEELVNEAQKFAKESTNAAAYEGLIADAQKHLKRERGPLHGPRVWSGYFKGDGVDWQDFYQVRCRGGEWTFVNLSSNGPAGLDVDIIVTDGETGQLVEQDLSVGPNGFVRFFVPYNKDYVIEVRNHTRNTVCYRYHLRAS